MVSSVGSLLLVYPLFACAGLPDSPMFVEIVNVDPTVKIPSRYLFQEVLGRYRCISCASNEAEGGEGEGGGEGGGVIGGGGEGRGGGCLHRVASVAKGVAQGEGRKA